MPIYGTYDEQFDKRLKPYIDNLNAARGVIECPQVNKRGPRNLLEELPDTFTYDDVVEVRRQQNLSADKTRYMLNNWKTRGYIVRDPKGQKDVWVKCKGKTHRNQ